MCFVDNAGADVVLGMLPFAREMLRLGCEVVLVANSLPAINDITAQELRTVVATAAKACPVLRAAREAALKAEAAAGGRVPPYPGMAFRRSSSRASLASLAGSAANSLGGAAASGGGLLHGSVLNVLPSAYQHHHQAQNQQQIHHNAPPHHRSTPSGGGVGGGGGSGSGGSASGSPPGANGSSGQGGSGVISEGVLALSACPAPLTPSNPVCPKLYILANGNGSPCVDFRRVPDVLAEACVGVELLVIEGMGRAIHTNFNARFRCDTLKVRQRLGGGWVGGWGALSLNRVSQFP